MACADRWWLADERLVLALLLWSVLVQLAGEYEKSNELVKTVAVHMRDKPGLPPLCHDSCPCI